MLFNYSYSNIAFWIGNSKNKNLNYAELCFPDQDQKL